MNGGRGRNSQDAGVVHFGGVIPSKKYRVEVLFPSGITTVRIVTPRLVAGSVLTINE